MPRSPREACRPLLQGGEGVVEDRPRLGAEQDDGRGPLGLRELLAQLECCGAVRPDGSGVGDGRGAAGLTHGRPPIIPTGARTTAIATHFLVITSATALTGASDRMGNRVTQ